LPGNNITTDLIPPKPHARIPRLPLTVYILHTDSVAENVTKFHRTMLSEVGQFVSTNVYVEN